MVNKRATPFLSIYKPGQIGVIVKDTNVYNVTAPTRIY